MCRFVLTVASWPAGGPGSWCIEPQTRWDGPLAIHVCLFKCQYLWVPDWRVVLAGVYFQIGYVWMAVSVVGQPVSEWVGSSVSLGMILPEVWPVTSCVIHTHSRLSPPSRTHPHPHTSVDQQASAPHTFPPSYLIGSAMSTGLRGFIGTIVQLKSVIDQNYVQWSVEWLCMVITYNRSWITVKLLFF